MPHPAYEQVRAVILRQGMTSITLTQAAPSVYDPVIGKPVTSTLPTVCPTRGAVRLIGASDLDAAPHAQVNDLFALVAKADLDEIAAAALMPVLNPMEGDLFEYSGGKFRIYKVWPMVRADTIIAYDLQCRGSKDI